MKKFLLTTVIVGALLTGNETKAQLGFSVNVHIGNRPAWGVPGNVNAGYYYMPEIDTYYDLANEQFIYEDAGQWVFARSLPDYYRNYDLRTGYKVAVNERRPYLRADFYRQQYSNRYNTYRREFFDDRNMRRDNRFDNRYDNRYDNRRDNRYEQQRGYNDRFNQQPQPRMDDRRFNQPQQRMDDRRFDQRNDGRQNDARGDQRNDRFDNRNDQRPNITAPQPQQRDDRREGRDNGFENRNANPAPASNDNNQNRSWSPGQVRLAQRRG